MKRLEAFSLGKKFDQPEANEDSFVVIPNVGYAVIDGVTDRNGTRYEGMLSGQYASLLVKRATEVYFLAQSDPNAPTYMRYRGPKSFISYLTDCLQRGYKQAGVAEAVKNDWKLRAGCTLMAAFVHEGRLEVVAVGDSGIRINGTDTLQLLKPLDDVMGILRREAWQYFAQKGESPQRSDKLAAGITWPGTANQLPDSETADKEVLGEIERRALAAVKTHLPGIAEAEIVELLHNGIAYGQGNFQNVDGRDLGYGGLDGFPVPERYIEHRSYELAEVKQLELFSDGYFKPGDGFGIEAWEKAFREVEEVDPHKIGAYLSTKGTTAKAVTDDRTYLGVLL